VTAIDVPPPGGLSISPVPPSASIRTRHVKRRIAASDGRAGVLPILSAALIIAAVLVGGLALAGSGWLGSGSNDVPARTEHRGDPSARAEATEESRFGPSEPDENENGATERSEREPDENETGDRGGEREPDENEIGDRSGERKRDENKIGDGGGERDP
jgi:hypothetical protein